MYEKAQSKIYIISIQVKILNLWGILLQKKRELDWVHIREMNENTKKNIHNHLHDKSKI